MKNAVKEIREAIENSDVEFFAVRATDDDMKVGDICRASHDWDYEHDQPSDKLLDGACGTEFHINWGASDEKTNQSLKKLSNTTPIITMLTTITLSRGTM